MSGYITGEFCWSKGVINAVCTTTGTTNEILFQYMKTERSFIWFEFGSRKFMVCGFFQHFTSCRNNEDAEYSNFGEHIYIYITLHALLILMSILYRLIKGS